jgi:ribosome-associated toxin RatA of RatAB toxin-antitoxin module
MSDMSRSTIVIEASMSEVSQVLFDLEKYPEWSDSITKVKVTERDEGGRVTGATLTIAAGAVKDEVSLSYNWDSAPERLEFELEDANMLTKMDGAYILKDLGDETEVTYELSVGLSMPIPQMMITKQEKTTIDQALAQLKEHCEG